MKRSFIVCLMSAFLLMFGINLSAQSVEGLEYVIDVNGLVPHTIVSHIDIVGALGQPDRIETRDGMDGDEVWYFYGDNYFGFRNGGEFFDFYVKDPRFKVLSMYFNGGLRVGASVSVFDDFPHGFLDETVIQNSYKLVNGIDVQLGVGVDGRKIKYFFYHELP